MCESACKCRRFITTNVCLSSTDGQIDSALPPTTRKQDTGRSAMSELFPLRAWFSTRITLFSFSWQWLTDWKKEKIKKSQGHKKQWYLHLFSYSTYKSKQINKKKKNSCRWALFVTFSLGASYLWNTAILSVSSSQHFYQPAYVLNIWKVIALSYHQKSSLRN